MSDTSKAVVDGTTMADMDGAQPLWGQVKIEPHLAGESDKHIARALRAELDGLFRDLMATVPEWRKNLEGSLS